ncbi:MAG: DUF378 domain-containing protein [Rickettsiaceae bacterium]|nr:DUF378 domain-containing protein [Rickettsiaceae bacterium]
MQSKSLLSVIALLLTCIGGLNWGLVGVFNFDLVAAIFGPMSMLSRVVYGVVGASSIISLLSIFKK